MALHDTASESLSGEGTRNVPRSDHPQGDDSRCLDTSSNCLSINFCNIRGLRSNFQSVEHHLSSAKPHLLFLTETQVSVATDSRPFSVPSYFLYTHFQTKAGCCVYVRNDITCSRAPALETSELSTIWVRLQGPNSTNRQRLSPSAIAKQNGVCRTYVSQKRLWSTINACGRPQTGAGCYVWVHPVLAPLMTVRSVNNGRTTTTSSPAEEYLPKN